MSDPFSENRAMQKQPQIGGAPHGAWWRSPIFFRIVTAALVLIVIAGALFLSYSWVRQIESAHSTASTTITNATDGAAVWVHDTQQTAPTFTVASPGDVQIAVDPLFQGYYKQHNGATSLGAPLTTAFPISQGWVQFFVSGALLLPMPQQGAPGTRTPADQQIAQLLSTGLRDAGTGIVRLPLIQSLLTVGSQVPIGGSGSHLTYVDLRNATNPDLMVPDPGTGSSTSVPASDSHQNVFIAGGTRGGKVVGHLVPAVIWDYISRPANSPDGWQNDFGSPLTEALSFTINQNGSVHQMLVQVFWRDTLLVDAGVQGTSSQPTITTLDTGLAYLRTLGPPSPALGSTSSVWALGDTALLNAPGSNTATAHVGQDFPLALSGDAAWSAGELWYHVTWQAPKTSGDGWVPAKAVTFTSPGKVPGWASFDLLSPDLAQYLADDDDNVGVVVYDFTRQRYYTYNMDGRFIMGSSMKVAIMLTFLNMTEREGREPTDDETCLLTAMIEHSDNNAASAFFFGYPYALCGDDFEPIGGAQGVTHFMNQIGISGLDPDQDAWGYSTVSPLVMVHLLTSLQDGKVLTQQDRALALNLMENIESDQQVGVGDTAPPGATVAMKDGWLQAEGPDGPETGPWAMNSSGIVTLGKETYIISVYTIGNNTLQDGQAIARHVCSAVASALI